MLTAAKGLKSGVYNEEMGGEHFEPWFNSAITKLPQGSVVVMKNASYHYRRLEAIPTMSSRKLDIPAWLTVNGIPCNVTTTKKLLLQLLAPMTGQFVKFRVVIEAERAGCVVLMLHSYHCSFNPIERICLRMKGEVATLIPDFKIDSVWNLLSTAAENISPKNWDKAVEHVIAIQDRFREAPGLSDNVEPIIISLGEEVLSECRDGAELWECRDGVSGYLPGIEIME